LRALYLADVLRDAGLTIKSFEGWEERGGYGFRPKGVILHHTVTKATTADLTVDKMLAVTGSSTVPPPLCNYSTNRDGTISIIAAGTANHGGTGGWNGVSGNSNFFGDEMKNNGVDEVWPERQLESARIAAAALLKHLGQTDASMLCGHKEYALPAGRKRDPHTLDMTNERRLVSAIMEGDDMPLTEKEENTVRALLAALEATGAGTLDSRQALLNKMALIGKNYPTEPDAGSGPSGVQRGETVTVTGTLT
jgi:hypothetical protein